MSRLIPRSEWIAVLNCYLDDRDNDRGPVIVVGGIVFPARYLDALERSLDNFLPVYPLDPRSELCH